MSNKDSNLTILQKRVQVLSFAVMDASYKAYANKVGSIAGTMTKNKIDLVLVVFIGLPSRWFYAHELKYLNGQPVKLYRPRDIPKLEGRVVQVKPNTLLYHPDNKLWTIIEVKPDKTDYPIQAVDGSGCLMPLALDEILYLNRKPVVIPDGYDKRS